jgi:hypothetical protein
MNNPLLRPRDPQRISIGDRLGFNPWRYSDGSLVPPDRDFIASVEDDKIVRWKGPGGGPPDVIVPDAAGNLPSLDELNAKIPQEQWEIGLDGRPRPPWARWHTVALLDPTEPRICSYGNSTLGMRLAVEDLRDRIDLMAVLQGFEALPVVNLTTAPMNTKYGKRPSFKVLAWRKFRGGALQIASGPSNALEEVKPVSLSREMGGDSVPF